MYKKEDIFKKIKRDDKEAFEILFKNLYSELCIFAIKYVKNLELAEEFVQDVFFKLWMNRKHINIKQNIKSYIYTSVKNKCLIYIQHQKVKTEYAKLIFNNTSGNSYNTDERIESNELEEIIEKTLDSFPDRMKNIFILSRYEGLKYQEIANKLSISVKTVEANISKALKIFKRKLGDYLNLQPKTN